jgi:hypothetical protein
VRQRARDFHQRASPAPRAYAINPTTPKCRTALTAAGWGSSRNGLAQIPRMSSGCNLHESACASGLAAVDGLPAAVSLPYGLPIGSSSENSSTDRSTTQFLVRVRTDPTPRMLQTSRGSATTCRSIAHLCGCNVGARFSFRLRSSSLPGHARNGLKQAIWRELSPFVDSRILFF